MTVFKPLNPLSSIKTTVLTTSRDFFDDKDMAWLYLIVRADIYKEQDLFNEYLERFNWHSEKERLIQLNKNFQLLLSKHPTDLLGLVQALRDISDPFAKMERELEDGYELNSFYAAKLSEDPKYLKDIANKALKSIGEFK